MMIDNLKFYKPEEKQKTPDEVKVKKFKKSTTPKGNKADKRKNKSSDWSGDFLSDRKKLGFTKSKRDTKSNATGTIPKPPKPQFKSADDAGESRTLNTASQRAHPLTLTFKPLSTSMCAFVTSASSD